MQIQEELTLKNLVLRRMMRRKRKEKSAMNKTLATMAIVSAALAVTPASAVNYISHWDFSSDPLGEYDYTGHNDLVNANGVTIADGAAVFDGTAREFISRHNVDFYSNRPYTIECFALAESDCNGMIMELTREINLQDSKGSFYIYAKEGVMVKGGNGRYNGEQFDNGDICDGQWHHIAVIVNPSGATAVDQVQLYLDGVRQTKHVQNNTGSSLSAYRLYIGSRGGTSLPFKGKIDDVRITEGILSPSEFLQARSSETLNVRGYWKFDDGNALADSSGNGNTLQGSQGVTFTNGCASFNGSASDVRTALDLSAYTNVTVECFVRKHAGTDDVRIILEHSQNGAGYPEGFYLSLDETGAGTIRGIFRFGNDHCYGDSPTYSVNTGWHHLALVKDSSKAGSDSCISLYVDGVRATSYKMNSKSSGNPLRNDYLYLGSRNNSQLFLDADIDDVRITANVLAPGQFLRTRTGALDDAIAYWPFEKADMYADASGNGNVLTGSGVTVGDDGAAVFNGSQSGFSTLAPLPLYAYRSMTMEWFMLSSASDTGIVLETTAKALNNPGAFYAAANEFAGFQMTGTHSLVQDWAATDGMWHHYALVYDWDSTTYDIVRLYRDGVQVTTRYSSNSSAARLRAGTLFIGARNGSPNANGYPFVGELDDIRITGRALAPAEFLQERTKPIAFVITLR